jgi:alpha-ribazole phosphatase
LALALGLEPQSALGFIVENCSLTRLDFLSPPGSRGLWRVAGVNLRPWGRGLEPSRAVGVIG